MHLAARIICVLLAVCLPAALHAHAQLNGSEPAANALVQDWPESVELWFSEPVSPVAMRWISPDGETHPSTAEQGGKQVSVAPPPVAGEGSYLLAWRVVSLDGHPVSGILVISIGTESEVPSLGGVSWAPASTWAAIAAKLLLTICLILGVGGAVYQTFVARQTGPAGTVTLWSLFLAFPAALFLVWSQGVDLLGLSLGSLFSAEAWVAGASTSTLRTAILAALSALTALILLRSTRVSRHRAAASGLAIAAWMLAAVSYAVSGHTATAEPEWQAVISMVIHALAVIFWIGALMPLLTLIRSGNSDLAELRRFSAFAMPLVALLIVSGVVMTSIHAGSGGFRAMAVSNYGILLFVKLVAAIGLLLIAAHNRLVLTPAMDRRTPGAPNALRGSIHVEIVLALLILVVASSFRLAPPPILLTREPQVQIVSFKQSGIDVELAISPGVVGPNEMDLSIGYADGAPLVPVEFGIGFSMPEKDLGPITVSVIRQAGESWTTEPFILPQPGVWNVEIDILVTDFDITKLNFELTVEP